MQAPVLAQHTLSYIFSVRPQDRATYFKTLLEVTDLDDLRNDVAALATELTPPDDSLLTRFDKCSVVPVLRPKLAHIARKIPDLPTLTSEWEEAAKALIEGIGEQVPASGDERLILIERALAERRSKTFPVTELGHGELVGWNPPAPDVWYRIDSFVAELKKVDQETRQLAALFNEALKIPAIAEIKEPTDCPLCGIETALTPKRVKLIRQHVEDTRDFKAAETAAKNALTQLIASGAAALATTEDALPPFLNATAAKRRQAGFTVARIRELVADRAAELVDPWLATVRPLVRAAAILQRSARAAQALAERQSNDSILDLPALQTSFETLAASRTQFATALQAYDAPARAVVAALNGVIDAQGDTGGWEDFIAVAREPAKLRGVLLERAARAVLARELDTALKQIDRAKEQVLDDKFSDYSELIQKWWERLRPDEATFFSALQPRKGAKRTIDIKAGLSINPDRSAPKVRDVIAIFSQSQLHCLGLALFLARAEHEALGFIVLDDPVLSSDEDYRVHFNATVLAELGALPIQTIVITQDHDTWEELETRYRHVGISTAQLYIETPAEGSIIDNTSDALLAKISRAKSLARGGHPDSRKECGIQLRDAGERFCKEMFVNHRRANGEATASLTDYDGKTLEWLCPRVDPLLDHDPSHPGKLEAFKNTVNNACHDNAPPGTEAMTQACGEISFLQKEYLPR